MRMKKSLALASAIAAVGVLTITGCAPGGASNATAPTESDGKITVWTAIAGAQLEEMKTFATGFEKEHDVKVEIVAANDAAIKQKVQAATASGDFPDIVQYFGGSFMQPLVDANAFLPLDDYVAESAEWEDQMVDSWAENYTFDDEVYAVPFESPLVQLFYNTEILNTVGIEAPSTFDELLSAIVKLKEAGYVPIAVDGQSGWPMQQWFAYLVMRNGGTDAVHEAVAGDLPWDDEIFLKSAEQLQQLIDAGAFQEGFLGEDGPATLAQFTSGKAALTLSGSWFMNQIVSADDPTLIERVDYAAFPTVPGGVGVATDVQGGPNGSLAIARLSPDADLSWEFIKGFTSNDVATRVANNALTLVPNKVEISGDQPAVFAKMVAELPTYTGFNIFWNEILSPELNTEFTNLQNALVAGQITPQEMVSQMQDFAESNQ